MKKCCDWVIITRIILILTPLFGCKGSDPSAFIIEPEPVVVITDLYFPYQDPGDNLDLINAFSLPGVDLKGVILDCYNPFRKEIADEVGKGLFPDRNGPREPGYICVQQLNYIFKADVPCGVGPFEQMRSKKDKMEYIPEFQNQGINLLKRVLLESEKPVSIASFGSSRVLAVAFNRFPELLKRKVKMIHLSAGTSGNNPEYLEWNVALDTLAFVTLMESGLPISLYPCASGIKSGSENTLANAFMADSNNTYYKLESLSFINLMDTHLKQYLYTVFSRKLNAGDYLSFLDKDFNCDSSIFNRAHNMWETSVWMSIARLKLVKSLNQQIKIISQNEIQAGDEVFNERLVKCSIKVKPSGLFEYQYDENGRFFIYERGNVNIYQQWMNTAIPEYFKYIIIN